MYRGLGLFGVIFRDYHISDFTDEETEQVGNLPKAICLVRGERRIKPKQSRVHQQPSPKAITFFS